MSKTLMLAILILAAAVSAVAAHGQEVHNSTTCNRNVTVARATASGTETFMPTFVANWWKKNAKHYPDVCFALPSADHKNFVIVISTSSSAFNGLFPTVHTYTSTDSSPFNVSGTVYDQRGSAWEYTASGTINTTTTTTVHANVPYTDSFTGLYANAYDSSGQLIKSTQHIYTSRSGGESMNTLGYNLGSALTNINARNGMLKSLVKAVEKQGAAVQAVKVKAVKQVQHAAINPNDPQQVAQLHVIVDKFSADHPDVAQTDANGSAVATYVMTNNLDWHDQKSWDQAYNVLKLKGSLTLVQFQSNRGVCTSNGIGGFDCNK